LEAWLGLIGALGGVLIAGVIERVRLSDQFLREKRWEHDQDRRKRLEELFEVIDEIRTGYKKSFNNAIMRVEHGHSEVEQTRLPISRMRMLVGIYAPEATEALMQFENAYQQYGDALAATIGADSSPKPERQRILGALMSTSIAIFASCDELGDEVVRAARNLTLEQIHYRRPLLRRTTQHAP
jgi:hypothetical protein